ncbi:seryl-tRNA synthetase-like [Planoprotostelium fungivorum]|uniref:serine--tRNA ligase n=1 Tax=Planoprotostelium fungivorum TaxID=1890364 RepID=A0A2P6MRR1_9EUKA|nr:seryl-tRNA synthetase-like [Planoprotostelium fungivorum]
MNSLTARRAVWYWNKNGKPGRMPFPNPPRAFEHKFVPDFQKLQQNRDAIVRSCQLRGDKQADVNKVMQLHDRWTTLDAEIQKQTTARMKSASVDEAREVKVKINALTAEHKETETELIQEASKIPNEIHPDAPESTPRLVYTSNHPISNDVVDHITLGKELDLFDLQQCASVTGDKFVYLKNEASVLELALIHWSVNFLIERGFTVVSPPDLIRQRVATACGFSPKDSDLCLTGTAEIPLTALYANRIIPDEIMPIKMVGFSHCFRMEPPSNTNKGIYRLHQFSKVEMVMICKPEESERRHQEMLEIQKEMVEQLDIPYQVLDMPVHDLGATACRKYDIEAWMPHRKGYGEITSLSNCLDYQSRRLGIKYRYESKPHEEFYAHTLNGTAVAVPRVLCAILENCQSEGKIHIPKALHPHSMGLKEIVFK